MCSPGRALAGCGAEPHGFMTLLTLHHNQQYQNCLQTNFKFADTLNSVRKPYLNLVKIADGC